MTLDVHGIRLEFSVNEYRRKESAYEDWCDVDFHIQSGQWLDYHITGELLLRADVDGILSGIDRLVTSGVDAPYEWPCTEPDFHFMFHPPKDLTKDPKYTYVAPGYEIEDIKLEWSVYFWDRGLTDNRLTLTLFRRQITALREYLRSVVLADNP